MAKVKVDYTEDFRVALQIPKGKLTGDKLIAVINARLVALGHFSYCSRCGGSGHYSFNLMYGTVCFKCHGAGKIPVKLTKKLISVVAEEVKNGGLEEYFRQIKIKLTAKKATKLVMAAWTGTGISDLYDWRKSADHAQGRGNYPEDNRLSKINAKICAEYDRVCKIERKYFNAERDRKSGKATLEEVDKLAEELVAEAEKAVANIKEYAKEI